MKEYEEFLVCDIAEPLALISRFMYGQGCMNGRGMAALLAFAGSSMLHAQGKTGEASDDVIESVNRCFDELNANPSATEFLLLRLSKAMIEAQHMVECEDNKGEA